MTREQWLKLLEEDPWDPERRLAFADWLEEQGQAVEAVDAQPAQTAER